MVSLCGLSVFANKSFRLTSSATVSGSCPAKYNTVDTTKTVLQCPDGVTNVRYCAASALNVTIATKGEAGLSASTKRILVAGDSWGTVVAGGSKFGLSFFARKLKEHKCDSRETSIAVPGSTSTDWIEGGQFHKVLQTALLTKPDYLWMIILGNDALMDMQDCAQDRKKTAAQCGDQLFAKSMKNMGQFVDDVHKASPNTKIVGFGYDTMFGGLGCGLVTRAIFPQCYRLGGGGNRCFNEQFLRIQKVWDTLASNRSWVHNTTILGVTQVAGGDSKASTGPDRHIDMDKMGPAKYWPDYEGCFHPGVLGGDKSGAMIVMEEFHRMYWGKELGCP